MEEKEKIGIFDSPEKKESKKENIFRKRVGIIRVITSKVIVIKDSVGNGISIPFSKEKHAKLKVGDQIDLP